MSERKYLPTFADLVDRLSIVLLKSIFIGEHHNEYLRECDLIEHDIDNMLGGNAQEDAVLGSVHINAEAIRAIMAIMLANRFIWENEAKVRAGERDDTALRVTHAVNGVRNRAKNVLSRRLGERLDLKVDCLAADLPADMGNWNLFEEVK